MTIFNMVRADGLLWTRSMTPDLYYEQFGFVWRCHQQLELFLPGEQQEALTAPPYPIHSGDPGLFPVDSRIRSRLITPRSRA